MRVVRFVKLLFLQNNEIKLDICKATVIRLSELFRKYLLSNLVLKLNKKKSNINNYQ